MEIKTHTDKGKDNGFYVDEFVLDSDETHTVKTVQQYCDDSPSPAQYRYNNIVKELMAALNIDQRAVIKLIDTIPQE